MVEASSWVHYVLYANMTALCHIRPNKKRFRAWHSSDLNYNKVTGVSPSWFPLDVVIWGIGYFNHLMGFILCFDRGEMVPVVGLIYYQVGR